MPTGTPYWPKCPKCKRGKWGYPRPDLGVRVIGNGIRPVRSNTSGFGKGGPGFYGYPGLVRCLDCGHEWFSTLPSARRIDYRMAHPHE
jgi:hypothetical protein